MNARLAEAAIREAKPVVRSSRGAGRTVAILAVSSIVIMATFLVGVVTGAQMPFLTWLLSALVLLAASAAGIAIGFACGFAVRGDGAFAATSAIIVLSAFGGGLTIPLDQMGQFFQDIAPWTPLWGAGQLVLLPMSGSESFTWGMVINLCVWTLVFSGVALWGIRRDTGR